MSEHLSKSNSTLPPPPSTTNSTDNNTHLTSGVVKLRIWTFDQIRISTDTKSLFILCIYRKNTTIQTFLFFLFIRFPFLIIPTVILFYSTFIISLVCFIYLPFFSLFPLLAWPSLACPCEMIDLQSCWFDLSFERIIFLSNIHTDNKSPNDRFFFLLFLFLIRLLWQIINDNKRLIHGIYVQMLMKSW